MKKKIVVCLMLSLTLLFAGCGNKQSDESAQTVQDTANQEELEANNSKESDEANENEAETELTENMLQEDDWTSDIEITKGEYLKHTTTIRHAEGKQFQSESDIMTYDAVGTHLEVTSDHIRYTSMALSN